MIPLRHRALVSGTSDPFVIKLMTEWPGKASSEIAILRERRDTHAVFNTEFGEVEIEGFDPDEGAGDVLLVLPHQNLAHRLIRAKSPHNTLLVTERCDQLCVMCSQPPKQHHFDMFEHLTKAALLAPHGVTLGISGGEPLLYKQQLFGMLQTVFDARPDISFHVLTNAQHVEDQDQKSLSAFPQERLLWGVPLYSAMAGHHDELVGKVGAFEQLTNSISTLAKAGAAIELRTVILKANVMALPMLANMITRKLPFIVTWAIMQLENIGYGRMNWDKLFLDTSEDFSLVARAVNIARGRGISTSLYNFPLCTVPPAYRQFSRPTISDWKRKYLPICGDCSLRADCGGFFEWYLPEKGFQQVGL